MKQREKDGAYDKGKEVIADGRRTAETEAAEDVDGSRISPGRMRVCSRSPTAIGDDSQRDGI